MGFEPTQGDPIGLAGRRLSRSAKVSSDQDQHVQPENQEHARPLQDPNHGTGLEPTQWHSPAAVSPVRESSSPKPRSCGWSDDKVGTVD